MTWLGLMCTKQTPLHYFIYFNFCIRYTSSVNCITFPTVCCTSSKSFIGKVRLGINDLKAGDSITLNYVHYCASLMFENALNLALNPWSSFKKYKLDCTDSFI